MGCGDACPLFPGKRYLDWDLTTRRPGRRRGTPHPDEIRRHVEDLLTELASTPRPAERLTRSPSVLFLPVREAAAGWGRPGGEGQAVLVCSTVAQTNTGRSALLFELHEGGAW